VHCWSTVNIWKFLQLAIFPSSCDSYKIPTYISFYIKVERTRIGQGNYYLAAQFLFLLLPLIPSKWYIEWQEIPHETGSWLTNIVLRCKPGSVNQPHSVQWTATNRPMMLTLILLKWRIWWDPNNASKWQMGFNSVFKGLKWRKSKAVFCSYKEAHIVSTSRKTIRRFTCSQQYEQCKETQLLENSYLMASATETIKLLPCHFTKHIQSFRLKLAANRIPWGREL